jgi:hypothetical protein
MSVLGQIENELFEQRLRKAGVSIAGGVKEEKKEEREVASRDWNEEQFVGTMTKMVENGFRLSYFEIHLAVNTGELSDFIESRYTEDSSLEAFEHVCYQMHESTAKMHEVLCHWIANGYQPNFLACSRGIWVSTAGRNLQYVPPKKNSPPHYVGVRIPAQGSVEKEVGKYCANLNVLRYFGFGDDNEWILLFERINFPINWKWESFKDSNPTRIVNHYQKSNVNYIKPVKVGDQYFAFAWTKK